MKEDDLAAATRRMARRTAAREAARVLRESEGDLLIQ